MRNESLEILGDARIALYRLGNAIAWEIDVLKRNGVNPQAAHRKMMGETGLSVSEIKDLVAAVYYYGEEYAAATDPRAVGAIARRVNDEEEREALIARCIEDEWTYQRAEAAAKAHRPERKRHKPSRDVARKAWDDIKLETGWEFEELDQVDAHGKVGIKQDLKTLERYL